MELTLTGHPTWNGLFTTVIHYLRRRLTTLSRTVWRKNLAGRFLGTFGADRQQRARRIQL